MYQKGGLKDVVDYEIEQHFQWKPDIKRKKNYA